MASQSATFYAYVNTGLGLINSSATGSAYAMLNTGLGNQDHSPAGSAYAMLNTSIGAQQASSHTTSYSYFNLGLPVQENQTVVHGARGWGVLPAGSQQFIVLKDSARAASYSYLNTTEQ